MSTAVLLMIWLFRLCDANTTTGYLANVSSSYNSVTYTPIVTQSLFTYVTHVTNTPYPCRFGVCNKTCCEEDSNEEYFECNNGQKIKKSLVCNRENNCNDGSDESRCFPRPPKIIFLPKNRVEVFCGDQEKEKAGTLTLECRSVGHPTPVIKWKKYDGHVPSKCQQYSKQGHGILTCKNFQQSDQGAYSCVAENKVKLAESQPKSIVKCSNTINCAGFRVVNEELFEHCLECYCSGKSSQCQGIKSNLTVHNLKFKSKTELLARRNGDIIFIPTKSQPTPVTAVKESTQEITYCILTENNFEKTSFLKSFGRNIILPRYNGKIDFLSQAPDIIIRGNNISLMYKVKLISPIEKNQTYMFARFWPGNWHHLNKKVATREDLMKVLSNVDALFIRCEYQQGNNKTWDKVYEIYLETSVITNFPNSVSYVEKCQCPPGYDGLSCESCAAGYKKKHLGNNFECEKIYVPPPCDDGYIGINCTTCDAAKGYYQKGDRCIKRKCHSGGYSSISPNAPEKCICKTEVKGDLCDECTAGYFNLHEAGCRKCWCSGVTNQCKSSNLRRNVISSTPRGGYNSSDGRNFWLLPPDFNGNRLTSYGGYLNYTMKFKPGLANRSIALTVELLSGNDVTLTYNHTITEKSTLSNEKSWSLPILETNWQKTDRSAVTRNEFLEVLSKIKAIYIESPFHLSSGQVNLITTHMSSATLSDDDGVELALAVEHCICPRGYSGLSCENCSDGYYRKRNGTVTQCIKCNCSNCDPEFGCPDCPNLTYRDNPETEKTPICKTCPCNGNGVSCIKDDHNQIFCRCKSGFTGMHCENTISEETDELEISISPRKIKGKKTGTAVSLNCSYSCNEQMVLSARKIFKSDAKNSLISNFIYLEKAAIKEKKVTKNFEVVLEDGLERIECIAEDTQGKLVGHVVATVEDLVTFIKPIKFENCYSDRIDVKEWDSKEIICEATGSPTPTVNWYRAVGGTLPQKVDTSDGVHTIESASLKDNGTIYTCIAENSEGDKATCTKVLIVRKKCEVINIFPEKIIADEGKNISIQCKTTAKSPVVWSLFNPFSDMKNLSLTSRIIENNGSLYIINSKVSDSGIYMCSANGENGRINKTISVKVEEKKIPPMVNIIEYDRVLKVGESFEMNCLVTGNPLPQIFWSKLNGTLGGNVHSNGKTLKINRAESTNSGLYECKAQSSLGTAVAYISIEVEEMKYPPVVNVSEENIKVHDGDEGYLTCLAIGYPRPKLTWFVPDEFTITNISRKNNSMILIAPQESIKEEITFKVSREMDGLTIICAAENEVGKSEKGISVKVLHSKAGVNETVEFVPIGSYFELKCDFSGNLNWEKVGGLVGDECRIPNALMILSVQSQHNGTYTCKVDSDMKKIINLIVTGFVPKFLSSMKSFLVLPAVLKSSHELRIEMTFNPSSENGLLLRKDNNKFEIYLEKGKIYMNIYSDELENRKFFSIKTSNLIKPKRWFFLVVTIANNFVDLTIYNEKSYIFERKTEKPEDLNISMVHGKENFFVGGYVTPHHSMGLFLHRVSHFDGCISRLSIDSHEYDIVKESSYSQNVTLCRKCFEQPKVCGERGICLDAPTHYGYICVCPNSHENKDNLCSPSCAGKGCETQLDLCSLLKPCSETYIHKCTNRMYSLQCNCAYGYSGTICEKVQEYSFCAKGNGFVRLPSNLLRRRIGTPELIRMGFTLQKPDGQLFWQGDKSNHLSIAVANGKLKYVYQNQHSKLIIHETKKLEMNKKYTFFVKRINETAILDLTRWSTLESISEFYQNSSSKFHTNRVTGDIYLGNVPNNTQHIGHHAGLHGCILYISFGEKAKINLRESELENFNVFHGQNTNNALYRDSYELNSSNNLSSEYSEPLQ